MQKYIEFARQGQYPLRNTTPIMVFIVHSLTLLLSLLPLIATCLSSPRHVSVFKPAYFLLAGDSTTATQSVGGGGWGDGFLNFTLREGSSGRNYGHNGATTKSFREGGDLDRLISEAKTKTADYTVYVTIQFGHNDQKSTSGVNLTQYSDNLVAFAREVSSIGAIPVHSLFQCISLLSVLTAGLNRFLLPH
jgi:hypothetical protein